MDTFTRDEQLLFYGQAEPLPAQTSLRAGMLSMVFENGDLRYVRLGNQLVLLRVYWAVRDRNWGTAPMAISNLHIDAREDSFEARYVAQCANPQHNIDFRAEVTIAGAADGSLTFTLNGKAHSDFLRNRIGFCVLHPAEQAGRLCEIEHADGTIESAKLPRFIVGAQPLSPFEELRGLRVSLKGNATAAMRFEGDIFEMEDQRNWTDASFKTFCTPLRLPYPAQVNQGETVQQAVSVKIEGAPAIRHAATTSRLITFAVGKTSKPLPAIGLGQTHAGKPLTAKQIARLKALKLHHLRVDLDLSNAPIRRGDPMWSPTLAVRGAGSHRGLPLQKSASALSGVWQRELRRATKDASALGVPLEIALFVDRESAAAQLVALRKRIDEEKPKVSHWLIYPSVERQNESPAVAELVAVARKALAGANKKAIFAAGSDADFIFANKQAQAYRDMDAFCTPTNPQTHAFDNASLVESLAAQSVLVKSAQRLAKGKSVFITPVTFKARWNPYSTAGITKGAPPSDLRQPTLFGAAWTLGSIKYLAEAGAASATFYETAGARGVMERDVFPLWHVLADVGEFAGGEIVIAKSSEPLQVDGLLLRKGRRARMLLANFTDQPREVSLHGVQGLAKVKVLDASNAQRAMKQPDAWRAEAGSPFNGASITLAPYAIARIDA